jgi:hypothetical protein
VMMGHGRHALFHRQPALPADQLLA